MIVLPMEGDTFRVDVRMDRGMVSIALWREAPIVANYLGRYVLADGEWVGVGQAGEVPASLLDRIWLRVRGQLDYL